MRTNDVKEWDSLGSKLDVYAYRGSGGWWSNFRLFADIINE